MTLISPEKFELLYGAGAPSPEKFDCDCKKCYCADCESYSTCDAYDIFSESFKRAAHPEDFDEDEDEDEYVAECGVNAGKWRL